MKLERLSGYEVQEQRKSEDINSNVALLQHKKTKAKIVLIENDDENKVFYIGFKTPPKDDTGVAHILEHSVLCGSKNFPIKDPFVELVKGSLNTFLNAMTYPDKTVYPVASCNEKDFQNLMHVYLDAVFYPNMKTEPKIFQQEGWHYSLEDLNDPITINGVVYNEMKGAFSSPNGVLDREVFNSLFPNTEYGKESGGNPEAIPSLTYEQFVEFHNSYYHPSNSYIYLYGNMDMVEKLEWIDTHYLSKFDYLAIDSSIAEEKAFDKIREKKMEYSITDAESEEQNAYLSYNAVVGSNLDPKLYIAFSVLNYVLCLVPGAPIKQALVEKGIGKEVYSTYENGIMQPYFSVVAKGTDENRKEEFCNIIEQVLTEQAEQGLNEKALRAGIHYYEFRYREADFGSYPKGLIYGLQLLDSWLYDEKKPFIHLEANETYESLKELVTTGYFEELIKQYLLNNHHKSVVTVVPVKGLTGRKEAEVTKELEDYKASLTKEELLSLVEKTNALECYQEEPNSQEDLEKIPILTRDDIDEFKDPVVNEVSEQDGITYLFHDIFTNKIAYIRLLFDMKHVPARLLPYASLLKSILGYVDTKSYSYQELAHEIDLQTGGVGAGINSYLDTKDVSKYALKFEVTAKALYDNIPQTFAIIEELISSSNLEDTKRLYEIIAELRSRMQANMTSSGHTVAAMRAMAHLSKSVAVSEQMTGVSFYRFVAELESNFEQKKEELILGLKATMKYLFREEQLIVDCTATIDQKEVLIPYVNRLKECFCTEPVTKEELEVPLLEKNEGFMTSAQVQYVCRAGNFCKEGLQYTGALRVLRVIMGYEYLWNNVRVKGGAYGCMSSFSKSGMAYFVSYRDPNLVKTIETYEKAPEFLRGFDADERTIMKFIIGAMSDLDAPLTPSTRGSLSLGNYLSHVFTEDMKRERDEVLGITKEEIERMADYVEAFLASNHLCVVGNEDVIRESEALFDETKHLF